MNRLQPFRLTRCCKASRFERLTFAILKQRVPWHGTCHGGASSALQLPPCPTTLTYQQLNHHHQQPKHGGPGSLQRRSRSSESLDPLGRFQRLQANDVAQKHPYLLPR